ncbi:MAG: urea ABC transporter permease subunit UrtC [Clostridiales Family XIII bacterium]|jgi:urea transport system permease protein|nr:urea ABC transporter permease subunit UrtC [Clostridiales Family XIII bacterium]
MRLNRKIDIGILVFLAVFPLVFSAYRTELMGKTLVFILFAISLDLIWGYAGLMSFGHAVLFGIGGYIMGLARACADGVPDFMQRYGVTEVPAFIAPLQSPGLAFALGILIPGAVAAVLGFFIFFSRVRGVFFSLITLALAYVVSTFISNQQQYTNGYNGIGGLGRVLWGVKFDLTQLYYITLALAALVFVLCVRLTGSRFGKTLRSIRENEMRLTFLGYDPAFFKVAVFTFSGMIAGLAGVLYIPMNQFISPNEAGITLSTVVLVWLAVGGRGNLTGAVCGTMIVYWAQLLLSERISNAWTLILGVVIICVVFFLPQGVVGKLLDIVYHRQMREVLSSNDPS